MGKSFFFFDFFENVIQNFIFVKKEDMAESNAG